MTCPRSLHGEVVYGTRTAAASANGSINPTTPPSPLMAYKQTEQIAEMSDLVDRISTVERLLQGSPFTGSDPIRRSLTPPRHALMASVPCPRSVTTPSSLARETSKTAKAPDLPPPILLPLRRSLRLQMKQNSTLYRT